MNSPESSVIARRFAASVDVRQTDAPVRHQHFLSTFRHLAEGQALELVDSRDPLLLYHQLQAELPGGFGWEYLESGPAVWRVAVSRSAARSGGGRCCGACGGG